MAQKSKNVKIIDELTNVTAEANDDLVESGPFSIKQMGFLMEYAKTGKVAESLKEAKYTIATYRRDLELNPTFKQAVLKIQKLLVARTTAGQATFEGQLAEVIDILHEKVVGEGELKHTTALLKAFDMQFKKNSAYAKENVSIGQKVIINIDNQLHANRATIEVSDLETEFISSQAK